MDTHTTWSSWVESDDWTGSAEAAMQMMPGLATEVISLAIDPEVSIARIARVIAKDQVLATRVLRLANSSYSTPKQTVITMNDAIVRMGMGPVRSVVLAECFTSRRRDATSYGPQGLELMDHAIGTAYLARLVAEKIDQDADEAFMCGLLHDLGKLLLLKLSRDFLRYGAPTPSAQEIDTVFKERHAAIGARLLKQWQLPEALEHPVRFHHDPGACTSHKEQATVTYVANRLAHRYGFGCTPDPANLLEDQICTAAGLNATWLADLDRRAPGLFKVARQVVA
jgi:putative nucleotidyltransferase with HDIG domain